MQFRRHTFLILVLTLFAVIKITAQDTSYFEPQFKKGMRYVIKTTEDDVYTGTVKDETKYFVTIENRETHSTQDIRKSKIIRRSLVTDKSAYDEIVLGENIHKYYYMFSGSAFEFERAKGTSNSPWLIFESVDFAFNENWAITAGSLLFYPYTVGVKCAYKVGDNAYIGGHAMIMGDIFGGGQDLPGFWGYSALVRMTKGGSNRNFTCSAGILGINNAFLYQTYTGSFTNFEFLSIAYCNRFDKKVALNLEGWYFPRFGNGMVGASFKIAANETTAWSLGAYSFVNNFNGGFKFNTKALPLPYFGYTRRLN